MKLQNFIFIYLVLSLITTATLYGQTWKEAIDKTNKKFSEKDYNAALTAAMRSLKYADREFGDSTEYHAQSYSKIAEIYYITSNYEEAIQYFKLSKRLYQQTIGKEAPGYSAIVNNLSVVYQSLGRFSEAEPLLKEAIEIKKHTVGVNDTSYAKSLNNLGQLYQELGQFSLAEPLYSESLSIKKKALGENNESYATSLLNLALLYKTLGNFEKATENLEKAVDILENTAGDNNPNTAKAQFNLAMVYLALDRKDDAEPLLKKSQEYRKKFLGEGHPDYASTLFNLGMLKWSTEDYGGAEDYFKQALQIIEQKIGNAHPLYSSCLNSLGVINWIRGNHDDANNYFANAVYLRGKILGEDHPDYATSLHNYAGFLKDIGQYEKAEENYHKAFGLYISQINKYFAFLSEKEKAEYYSKMRERFEMFNCYVMLRYKENPDLIADMYDYRLATKALLLNSTKKVRRKILGSGNQLLIDKYNQWRSLKESLVNFYNMTIQDRQRKNINIDSLEALANSLEKEISAESEVFGNAYLKENVNWKDIQRKLKKDEAAVEIIRFRFFDRGWLDTVFYAALVLTAETKNNPKMVLLQNGQELEDFYIHNYKNSIRHRIEDKDSYKAYWAEIDNAIGDKSCIYLSPDGVYNKININALQKSDDRFIIDDQYVRLMTNTSDLANRNGKIHHDKTDACLFGYPDYNSTMNKENRTENKKRRLIKELPGTKREVEKISGILSENNWQSRIFMKNNATENTLKNLHNPEVLHIASHGYFLSDVSLKNRRKAFGVEVEKAIENPLLRSGLLFSGAAKNFSDENKAGEADNGILTAYEAMNLDLDNTSLVVLSACETGLGEIKNGEGVYGLQRAFQVAGVENIIMSLWKIDDRASQELMITFYDNWLKGESFVDSFKKAQLELKKKYRHPYYWGAFVIIGI